MNTYHDTLVGLLADTDDRLKQARRSAVTLLEAGDDEAALRRVVEACELRVRARVLRGAVKVSRMGSDMRALLSRMAENALIAATEPAADPPPIGVSPYVAYDTARELLRLLPQEEAAK